MPATASVLPEPTFSPTEVPVPSDLKMPSRVSRSLFRCVPQLLLSLPTSGLVRLRFVVYAFAI